MAGENKKKLAERKFPKFANKYGDPISTVTTGIANAISNNTYDGLYGHITKGMDAAYDTIQAAAGKFGPIGKAVSTVMGGIKLVNNVMSKIGGGTDGMTKTDAVLGSAFLAPIGWINGFGGSKADTYTRNLELDSATNGGYLGFLTTLDTTQIGAGKKYGLFSQGAKRKQNELTEFTQNMKHTVSGIVDTNTINNLAAQGSTPFLALQLAIDLGGGIQLMRAARSGMKLYKVSTFTENLIKNAQNIIESYKKGKSVKKLKKLLEGDDIDSENLNEESTGKTFMDYTYPLSEEQQEIYNKAEEYDKTLEEIRRKQIEELRLAAGIDIYEKPYPEKPSVRINPRAGRPTSYEDPTLDNNFEAITHGDTGSIEISSNLDPDKLLIVAGHEKTHQNEGKYDHDPSADDFLSHPSSLYNHQNLYDNTFRDLTDKHLYMSKLDEIDWEYFDDEALKLLKDLQEDENKNLIESGEAFDKFVQLLDEYSHSDDPNSESYDRSLNENIARLSELLILLYESGIITPEEVKAGNLDVRHLEELLRRKDLRDSTNPDNEYFTYGTNRIFNKFSNEEIVDMLKPLSLIHPTYLKDRVLSTKVDKDYLRRLQILKNLKENPERFDFMGNLVGGSNVPSKQSGGNVFKILKFKGLTNVGKKLNPKHYGPEGMIQLYDKNGNPTRGLSKALELGYEPVVGYDGKAKFIGYNSNPALPYMLAALNKTSYKKGGTFTKRTISKYNLQKKVNDKSSLQIEKNLYGSKLKRYILTIDVATGKYVEIPKDLDKDQIKGRKPIRLANGTVVFMNGDGTVTSDRWETVGEREHLTPMGLEGMKLTPLQTNETLTGYLSDGTPLYIRDDGTVGPLTEDNVEKENLFLLIEQSNANFAKRLRDPNRKVIKLADGSWGNFKLAWSEDEYGVMVYPEILEIDGQLVDLSNDREAAWESAVLRGDYIYFPSREAAEWFTTHYKQYYKGFDKFTIKGQSGLKFYKHWKKPSNWSETKIPYKEWIKDIKRSEYLNDNYDLELAYHNLPKEELERWKFAVNSENPEYYLDYTDVNGNYIYHLPSVIEFPNSENYIFLKKGTLFENPELLGEIDSYYNGENGLKSTHNLVYNNGRYYYIKPIYENRYFVLNISEYKEGGQMNVIPEGALHARLNHMKDVDEDLAKSITHKGIPVITVEKDGEIVLHAEIEHSEIIFTLDVTNKIEDLRKKWHLDKEDKYAIEAGKILVEEILHNTDDRVNLIKNVI